MKAVVSEGAGIRVGEGLDKKDGVSGPERLVYGPISAVMTAATTVFSNHGPPPPIADRIGRIAPRSVFLIYADPGMGGESTRQRCTTTVLAGRRRSGKCPARSTRPGSTHSRPSTSGA